MRNLLTVLLLLTMFESFSQVGINTNTPIDQVSLQVDGPNSGVLINRVALLGRDDTITVAGLSEPIAAAAAAGLMVYNTNTNGTGVNAVKPGFYNWTGTTWTRLVNEDSANDYTGWGDYSDTQFTSTSAGNVAANTTYYLPNNGGNTNESQIPTDVPTFYDATGQKITGRNGDGLNVTIEFKLRPTTNNDTRVTLGIDIGGSVGEIYIRDFALTRGMGQEHYYLSSFHTYTLGTWEANGGRVLIRSTQALQVYDIRYVLTRTHKAR